MLAIAARDITLYARDPKQDLELSGTRVYYGTAGAAVHVVDVEKREYRESTAKDLLNAAQLVHRLDNVHFFQRAMVCRDVSDNFLMDINTLYACAPERRSMSGRASPIPRMWRAASISST